MVEFTTKQWIVIWVVILSLSALGSYTITKGVNERWEGISDNYNKFRNQLSLNNAPEHNLKLCNKYTTHSITECIYIINEYHKLGEIEQ